jgi:hypothetical protein
MSHLRLKGLYVFIVIVTVIYCFVEAMGDGDLLIYLFAAGDLRKGIDIYQFSYINEQYHYYYSVLFALLISPFYSVPYYGVKVCWLLLNSFLFFHLFYLLMSSNFIESLSASKKRLLVLFVLLFSLRFFHENIHASQITILILWCTVYGLYLLSSGRTVVGSLLIATAINIKLLPLIFLPYLLYRGHFKAVFFICSFLVFFLFLPSAFIGHDHNMELLQSWYHLINPVQKQHILDVDERSFHGLSTLLSTLLVKNVPDLYAMDLRRNIADISLSSLAITLFLTRIFLLGFSLFFVRSLPFKKAHSQWQQIVECSYLLLLIPLIFPHQQHYAFLFIVPAFAVTLYYVLLNFHKFSMNIRVFFVSILSVIYLTSNLKVLLGEFNHFYEHFKILTYGALLLVPLLAIVWKRSNHAPPHVSA